MAPPQRARLLGTLLLLLAASFLTRSSATTSPCVSCPSTSTCKVYSDVLAPMCVCPSGQHLINGACSSATLLNATYLDAHNSARAAVGAPALTWSNTLAAAALQWAKTLTNCQLTHGGLTGANGDTYGQNLYSEAGYSSVNATRAVYSWLKEYGDYTYNPFGSGDCSSGKVCGHYTQAIWSTSTQVGCAATPCTWPGYSTATVIACDYYPAGNVQGLHPYSKISSATACKNVVCPTSATCTVVTGNEAPIPVCLCPAGKSMVNGACSTTKGTVFTTSLALYSAKTFSGTPTVLRVGQSCVNLPTSMQKKVLSYSAVFQVQDNTLVSGSTTQSCPVLYFWTDTDCYGTASGPLASVIPTQIADTTGSNANSAYSVSCGTS